MTRLCEAEEIAASDRALRLIARAAEGSVRDAVALLDQLATFGSGGVDEEAAARLVGTVDTALQHRLLTAVLTGDRQEVSALVAEIESGGWDPRHVYGEFLGYCRDALHLLLGGERAQVDLPEEESLALLSLARQAGYESLLRLLHQLLLSEGTVRRSEAATLALEVVWLRLAELPKLTRLEEILGGSPPRSEGGPPTPAGPPRGTQDSGSPLAATGAAEAQPAAPPLEDVPRFLDLVSRKKQILAAHLAEVDELTFADGKLRIYTPPNDPWLSTALEREGNRRVLESCMAEVWGEGAGWHLRERSRAMPVEPAPTAAGNPALGHPRVQAALDIFGGTAETQEGDNR